MVHNFTYILHDTESRRKLSIELTTVNRYGLCAAFTLSSLSEKVLLHTVLLGKFPSGFCLQAETRNHGGWQWNGSAFCDNICHVSLANYPAPHSIPSYRFLCYITSLNNFVFLAVGSVQCTAQVYCTIRFTCEALKPITVLLITPPPTPRS